MSGFAVTVGADTRPFEQGMKAALGVATQTAATIGAKYVAAAGGIDKAFAQTARNVGVSFGKGLTDSVSPAALAVGRLGIALGAVAAAYVAVTGAISQANAQMDRFIALGANADRAGVGVELFQKFSEAAKAAKMDVQEIEKALITAGRAVTPKFEQEDPIKKRLTDIFESGYTGDFESQGLAQYRSANTNEERIRAAVTAMQELRDVVGQTAAVDLAEKLFGNETAERIRSGRLDIDAIAASLDRQREDLITRDQVQQAQDFRDRLNEAYTEIDNALGVSVNLASAGQDILNVWLALVQAVASMTTAMDPLIAKIGEAKKASEDMMGALATALGAQAINRALFPNQGKTIYSAEDPATTPVPIAPPVPPRRPLDFYTDPTSYGRGGTGHTKAAKSSAPATETLDQVESFVNGIERSTEALKAEVEAIGKSSAERQSGINLARLEATARQQGITLTDAQIAKVKELSAATAEYRDKLEDAREAQQTLHSVGSDVLKGLMSDARNGASAMELLTSAVGRLVDRLSDKALDGLADVLFGKSSGTGGSGILGSLLGSVMGGGSSGIGGGGLDLNVGSASSWVMHSGGIVGDPATKQRSVNPTIFTGAPRFHKGLTSTEFPTILERGERVLTERQDKRMQSTMAGLAQATANQQPAAPTSNIIHGDTVTVQVAQTGASPEQIGAAIQRNNELRDRTMLQRLQNSQNRYG